MKIEKKEKVFPSLGDVRLWLIFVWMVNRIGSMIMN